MDEEPKTGGTPRTLERIAALHNRIASLPNAGGEQNPENPVLVSEVSVVSPSPSQEASPNQSLLHQAAYQEARDSAKKIASARAKGIVPPLPLHTFTNETPSSKRSPAIPALPLDKLQGSSPSTVDGSPQRDISAEEAMEHALSSVKTALFSPSSETKPAEAVTDDTDRLLSKAMLDSLERHSSPRYRPYKEGVYEDSPGQLSSKATTPAATPTSNTPISTPGFAAKSLSPSGYSDKNEVRSLKPIGEASPSRSPKSEVEIAVISEQVKAQIERLSDREEKLKALLEEEKEKATTSVTREAHPPLNPDNPYIPDSVRERMNAIKEKDLPDSRFVGGGLADLVVSGRQRYQTTPTNLPTPRGQRVTTPRGSKPTNLYQPDSTTKTETPSEAFVSGSATGGTTPRLGMPVPRALDMSDTARFSFGNVVVGTTPTHGNGQEIGSAWPGGSSGAGGVETKSPPGSPPEAVTTTGSADWNNAGAARAKDVDPSFYSQQRLGLHPPLAAGLPARWRAPPMTGRLSPSKGGARAGGMPVVGDVARWEPSSVVMLAVLDFFECLRGKSRGLLTEQFAEYHITGEAIEEDLLVHDTRSEWLRGLSLNSREGPVEFSIEASHAEEQLAWCEPWWCVQDGYNPGMVDNSVERALGYAGEAFRWRGAKFHSHGKTQAEGSLKWQKKPTGGAVFSLKCQEVWLLIQPDATADEVLRDLGRYTRILEAFSYGNGSGRSREQKLFEVSRPAEGETAISLFFSSLFTDGAEQEVVAMRGIRGFLVAHEEEGRRAVGRHMEEKGIWLSLDGSSSVEFSSSPEKRLMRSPHVDDRITSTSPARAASPDNTLAPPTDGQHGYSPSADRSGNSLPRSTGTRSPTNVSSLSVSKSPEAEVGESYPSGITTAVFGTAMDPEFTMSRAKARNKSQTAKTPPGISPISPGKSVSPSDRPGRP